MDPSPFEVWIWKKVNVGLVPLECSAVKCITASGVRLYYHFRYISSENSKQCSLGKRYIEGSVRKLEICLDMFVILSTDLTRQQLLLGDDSISSGIVQEQKGSAAVFWL